MRHRNQGRGRRDPATPQGAHGRPSYTLLHPSRVAMAFTLRWFDLTGYEKQLRSYRGFTKKRGVVNYILPRSWRSFGA